MTIALLVLGLVVGLVATLPGWLLRDTAVAHTVGAAVGLLVVATLGIAMLFDPSYAATGDGWRGMLTVLVAALAILGGGPVTAALLHRVDTGGPVEQAGNVLRGGAWIGVMERAAIFATVVGGWPDGLAVVLALKGLGRYPELKTPGAAERFIIGTFISVLWALAWAGILAALLR